MEESSRRLVYQHEEMRKKARRRMMQQERSNLPTDEKNSDKNGGDPRPLPVRHVLPEEDGREPDGDGSVERTKDADHCDLLHFHSEIAEGKGAGIEHAHSQHHPAHLAARKTHGLLSNKDR